VALAAGRTAGDRVDLDQGLQGHYVASTGEDGCVRRWDAVTGAEIGAHLTGHTGGAPEVCVWTTPDGWATLAAGGADGTVRIIDTEVINTLIAPAS